MTCEPFKFAGVGECPVRSSKPAHLMTVEVIPMHPHYARARAMMGQHVSVHAHGRIYTGVLHSVTPDGIYLARNPVSIASGEAESGQIALVPLAKGETEAVEPVFWPLLFLPFLAIAALFPLFWW